jgi:hypothetical protein
MSDAELTNSDMNQTHNNTTDSPKYEDNGQTYLVVWLLMRKESQTETGIYCKHTGTITTLQNFFSKHPTEQRF